MSATLQSCRLRCFLCKVDLTRCQVHFQPYLFDRCFQFDRYALLGTIYMPMLLHLYGIKNAVWVHFSVGFTFRCGVPRLFENCWSQTERLLSTKLNGNIHIWIHVWYMLGIALNASSRVKVHIAMTQQAAAIIAVCTDLLFLRLSGESAQAVTGKRFAAVLHLHFRM